jgi:hypothetical protein
VSDKVAVASKSVQHGVTTEDNAKLFDKLESDRKAGKLANNRELAAEGVEAPSVEVDFHFEEKSAAELSKMSKQEVLAYISEFSENAEKLADAKAEHAAKLAEVAAIHGIPRGKLGEPIQAMLENRPDHPGRGVPYALLDDDGEPRMTRGRRGREPQPITRIDN